MDGKLTQEEALAIQLLAGDPNWQKFKQYLSRLYLKAAADCETAINDHRFSQGRALELKMMMNIETKAYNILNGT